MTTAIAFTPTTSNRVGDCRATLAHVGDLGAKVANDPATAHDATHGHTVAHAAGVPNWQAKADRRTGE